MRKEYKLATKAVSVLVSALLVFMFIPFAAFGDADNRDATDVGAIAAQAEVADVEAPQEEAAPVVAEPEPVEDIVVEEAPAAPQPEAEEAEPIQESEGVVEEAPVVPQPKAADVEQLSSDAPEAASDQGAANNQSSAVAEVSKADETKEAEATQDVQSSSVVKDEKATDETVGKTADKKTVGKTADKKDADKKDADKKEADKKDEGASYPAVVLSSVAAGARVSLAAPEGSLPEGVQLSVVPVYDQAIFDAVEKTLEAQGRELTDAVAFDVTPLDKDGKEVQPKKPVSVTFSGTGLDLEAGDTVDVFRVSDDASTVTDMNGSGTANSQTFSTNHFTIYVSTGSVNDPNGDGTNNPNSTTHRYVLEYGATITLIDDDSS